jgi:hypothetical protein
LLGLASAVFLDVSPAGFTSIIFLPFIEREKRKLGVVVRETALEAGSRK